MLLHSSSSVGSACENRVKNEKPWERTEQKCSYCEIVKPISEFYDNLNWQSGKTAQCRKCLQIYMRGYQRGRRTGRKAKPSSG